MQRGNHLTDQPQETVGYIIWERMIARDWEGVKLTCMIQCSYVGQSSTSCNLLCYSAYCQSVSPSVSPEQVSGNKSTFLIRYAPFLRSCWNTSSCSYTSAASDTRTASRCWNLDSFGHLHKQAVSGLRHAGVPKQEADSWQGVATSQLSLIARPKGRDSDF